MHPIKIISRKIIAKDTWEIAFQCLETGTLNIEAGQYMRVVIPEIPGGVRENSRIFSIITSYEGFAIAFRASASAFKQYLINAPIGTEIVAHGPFGDFTLPQHSDDRNLNIVFVAGGIGIAPFFSMARLAAEEKLPRRILLLYANKDEESAAYLSELAELERQNKNFTLRHKIGLLDEDFLLSNIRNQTSNALYYIAGPGTMVAQTQNTLLKIGIAPSDIRVESFGS